MRTTFLVLVFLWAAFPATAEDGFYLADSRRILFLGDSNTFTGKYIQYLDAYLATRFPDRSYELINLGLPSETVTGLTEADHPFPRPDVHERLGRALAKVKPDVVVSCYGMNDGIYAPFSQERFDKYKNRTIHLIDLCRASKARVVLVTPPPFDPSPIRDKTLPIGKDGYGWQHPFEGYDGVLERYGEWLKTLDGDRVRVVDVHGAIVTHLAQMRKDDPKYKLSGDGVHLDATGHWLIAQTILAAWKAPSLVDEATINVVTSSADRGTVENIREGRNGLQFRWRTKIPMPHDPGWDKRLAKAEKLDERFNVFRLTVPGLAANRDQFAVRQDEQPIGIVPRADLIGGLDMLRLPRLSANTRSAQVFRLVVRRQTLLGPAWLSAVGHKRPDTTPGIPLNKALKMAESIMAEIRSLCKPAILHLELIGR